MPTYTYECGICGTQKEAIRKIDDRKNGPECCDMMMKQIIVPLHIQPVLGGGSFQGYKCPVTDEYVTSRKRRREIVSEHNLIEKG